MERLFTEDEWRAIAWVEHLTMSRSSHDGFHGWCDRRRLIGPTFAAGEFYVGFRAYGDFKEVRVYEAASLLDFAVGEGKVATLDEARENIALIGGYLPELISTWASRHSERALEMVERRAQTEAYQAAQLAKEQRRLTRKLPKRTVAVFEASRGACHYCSTALDLRGKWHIEHKMPRALKGGSEMHNLVAACVPCNMRKKDKTDLEFQALLATESAIAQASQGGGVGADPSGFDSLNSHAAEFCPGEPRNATQLSGGGL